MSILVGNIRLPLEASEEYAFAAARKKCELSGSAVRRAHLYRASIDARRGRITRVLSVLLELVPDRADDRNREAAAKLIDVEKRLKGGK